MAKITITIEANSVADYQEAIELLSGNSTFDETGHPEVEISYNEQTGIPEGKVVGEPVRRPRRTKAQIESDARAAAEGKPTSGSATTAAEGSQGQKDSSPQQPAGQSQSGGQDIFGDQIKEIAAEAEAKAKAKAEAAATASNLTAADVKAALTKHVGFHGNAAKAKNVILKAFASIDGTPCAKISDVQEKDYAAVVEQLLEGVA